ncbi:MAG: lasso peptide biosynthesis B2 protein [Cyanophyceae cyanobacterium]
MCNFLQQKLKNATHSLTRLGQLSLIERQILWQALLWVVLIRLALSLFPFMKLRTLMKEVVQRVALSPPALEATRDQILWAVQKVSRRIPGATCLTQALAARILLSQYHYPHQLCIGVDIGSGQPFSAHAWLEAGDQVLIGQLPDLSRYTKLPIDGELL